MPEITDLTVVAGLNKLEDAEELFWLIELNPNPTTVIRLTNNNADVTFQSNVYTKFPFVIGRREEDTQGSLNRLVIVVSNVTQEFSQLLDKNIGFTGQAVIVSLMYGTVPTLAFSETFRIVTSKVTSKVAQFTLGNDDLLRIKFPAQTFFRKRCRWTYKGPRCAYKGDLPTCDFGAYTANGCAAHDNIPQFGGFLGIPAR